jgi:hypothetical protein
MADRHACFPGRMSLDNQIINVVRLSGPIIVNLIPKPQPTVPRIADTALETDAKLLIVEVEPELASCSTTAPDTAPAQ